MSNYSTQVIIDTINDLFPFKADFLICQNFDEPLTGRKFRFSKVELVYLFLELEKRIGIVFDCTVLQEYGMSTINKISNAIDKIAGETNLGGENNERVSLG